MYLGYDIGGTKTEILALDQEGRELFRKRIATVHDYPVFLENLASLLSEAEASTGLPAESIGIGIPGCEDGPSGRVKNANATFLNGHPLSKDLAEALGRPVALANDANCFALSEAIDGAGAGANVVFGVIMGTGCGGGVVIDGHVLIGRNGCAGEWGHNALPHYDLERDGPVDDCFCGSRGCVEQFISGTGLLRQYQNASGERLHGKEFFQRVAEGDEIATQVYHRFIDQAARAMANVVNLIDPDVIVIGGGLSNASMIYPDLEAKVSQYTITHQLELSIRPARYGDSSGIRGAAWLGRDQIQVST